MFTGRTEYHSTPEVAALTLERATPDDAAAIAMVRTAAADDLTTRFGVGHWSSLATERSVLSSMDSSSLWVMRQGREVIATLRLATRKPWAIDPSYFTRSQRPLYLTDMAVHPRVQRTGVGRRCLEDVQRIARAWPADAIRLDAYDAPAGAGPFYAKCGYREVGRATYRGTPLIYFEFLL
ncbi:MAG TPA: GNAT family N-acetyltransferase [Gemmatimonadaceae bacterium]